MGYVSVYVRLANSYGACNKRAHERVVKEDREKETKETERRKGTLVYVTGGGLFGG